MQSEHPKSDEEEAPSAPSGFEAMGLDPVVLQALAEMGFLQPTEVQTAVYARAMAGRDLIVQSKTGSGKTAAFGIPLASGRVDPATRRVQALALCPTRELALQVASECSRIGVHKGLEVLPVYGGAPMGKQIDALKEGVHIVVGTPGRLLDHLKRRTLDLSGVKVLVLDEADEMLSMGFLEDILAILERLPKERQTLLFSATVSDDIARIAKRHMIDPERIELSGDFIGVPDIEHRYYMVSGIGRVRDLARVLELERPESTLVFCNTREDTALVASYLRRHGFGAEAISSDLSQKEREAVMSKMRRGEVPVLVATDIAARGIDISDLSHVFNYTLPESAEVYIHRTGRTGRAGKSGIAISLVAPRELGALYYLKLLYKIKPEERELPTEAELKTRRESEQYAEILERVPESPGEQWRSLARRLWSSAEGERVVAALLQRLIEGAAATPASTEPPRTDAPPEPPRPESPERDPEPARANEPRSRGGSGERRERGARAGGGGRGGDRSGRGRSGRRGRRDEGRTEAGTSSGDDDRDFWEAWADERTRKTENAEGSEAAVPPAAPLPPLESGPKRARLYLNVGRRDHVRSADVQALVAERTGLSDAKIEFRNTHTYLLVPEEEAPRVIEQLSGTTLGSRTLVCEPAKRGPA